MQAFFRKVATHPRSFTLNLWRLRSPQHYEVPVLTSAAAIATSLIFPVSHTLDNSDATFASRCEADTEEGLRRQLGKCYAGTT